MRQLESQRNLINVKAFEKSPTQPTQAYHVHNLVACLHAATKLVLTNRRRSGRTQQDQNQTKSPGGRSTGNGHKPKHGPAHSGLRASLSMDEGIPEGPLLGGPKGASLAVLDPWDVRTSKSHWNPWKSTRTPPQTTDHRCQALEKTQKGHNSWIMEKNFTTKQMPINAKKPAWNETVWRKQRQNQSRAFGGIVASLQDRNRMGTEEVQQRKAECCLHHATGRPVIFTKLTPNTEVLPRRFSPQIS